MKNKLWELLELFSLWKSIEHSGVLSVFEVDSILLGIELPVSSHHECLDTIAHVFVPTSSASLPRTFCQLILPFLCICNRGTPMINHLCSLRMDRQKENLNDRK